MENELKCSINFKKKMYLRYYFETLIVSIMNCSAASRGVSGALEQLQLLLIELFIPIFCSLYMNICFDDCLIAFYA